MYRDEELRKYMNHEYKLHQMEQNRIKREKEKQRRQQKIVANLEHIVVTFMTFFSIAVMFIFCVAVSMLDSGSWIPFVVAVVCTIYLFVVGLLLGYLR